jgi:hypothetical protein
MNSNINSLRIVQFIFINLKFGLLSQMEVCWDSNIITLGHYIEHLYFNLSMETKSRKFWKFPLFFPNLISLELKYSFTMDIKSLMKIIISSKVLKKLTLDVLPISNYFDEISCLNKLSLEEFGINISENPDNCVLEAISKMKFGILNLISNRLLTWEEKEFLIEMLRNNSSIFKVTFYEKPLKTFHKFEYFRNITKMNKIKTQIESRFKFVGRVPGNLNFRFQIERNFPDLYENSAKKMKLE